MCTHDEYPQHMFLWRNKKIIYAFQLKKKALSFEYVISDLPHIDAVVISHNHYDHLDQSSVEDLNKRFGPSLSWYVAEGQAQWMKDRGCKTVVELSWWDENRLLKNGKEFVFACTPSQHWTQRGLLDRNKVGLVEFS